MDNTLKDRLIEYLAYKRISRAEFGRVIGVSSSYVTSMRKGLSNHNLMKVKEAYPDLNTQWLLYGVGEMLNAPITLFDTQDSDKDKRIKELEAQVSILKELIKEMRATTCERIA